MIVFNDITKIKQQTKMLEEQSRFAAMGEMISMIAHQWRQPLTTMTTIFSKMKLMQEMGMLTSDGFDTNYEKLTNLTQYMTKTIEDFRNFFKSDVAREKITLTELVEKPKRLVEPTFLNYEVSFNMEFYCDAEMIVKLPISKFDQVLLNLYKNSLDEFKSKDIRDPFITVKVYETQKELILKICDNAGGIPEDIISKIFEPYFSTKSKNGTGIGLYMSKVIIEDHLQGKIGVENEKDGAVFTIELSKDILNYD